MKLYLKNLYYGYKFRIKHVYLSLIEIFGTYNSPFIRLKYVIYFGEIKHGTPYFLPRKWVKCNIEDAIKSLQKMSSENKVFNVEKYGGIAKYYEYYTKSYTKPIPIKYFGFDYTSLGWKTKYNDIRFEWSPSISLVIFGKQLFIVILPKMGKKPGDTSLSVDFYWEAYLTYKYRTDKSKSKQERLEQTMKEYSCTWGNKEKGYFNYYPLFLKKKYIK